MNGALYIDNFLENPELERELALKSDFQTIVHNGITYRGIAMVEDEKSIEKIQAQVGAKGGKSTVFWRRYLDDEENETYIHNDSQIGVYSAVLFLNPPEQCKGGIAFWRHKLFGWYKTPTVPELEVLGLRDEPELWKKVYDDGFDEYRWEMIDYVPMEWNRLVLFSSHAFHSRYPKQAFGKSLEDARLIKTFFYTPGEPA